jgi:thioredoxin-like negative regulator of GroEL
VNPDVEAAEGILQALSEIDETAAMDVERAARVIEQLAETDGLVGLQRATAARPRSR